MDKLEVFNGVTLSYVSYDKIHHHTHEAQSNIIEINYCKEGRIGWDLGNNNKIFLGHGDFSIQNLHTCSHSKIYYPTSTYNGLNISINLDTLLKNPPEDLKGVENHIKHLYMIYCENEQASSFTGNEETENIFSFFYNESDFAIQYYKIKVIELLLYLFKKNHSAVNEIKEYKEEQIEIIKKVHDYTLEHISERITIDDLSKYFSMNPTTLKSMFKDIYGDSIAAHTKAHRMTHAANLLKTTNLSLLEISQEIGYESQSKFTAAFKEFYNILPSEYRKNK